jgi:glucose/arabinose dehydrogenase
MHTPGVRRAIVVAWCLLGCKASAKKDVAPSPLPTTAPVASAAPFHLVPVAKGLAQPVGVVAAGDGTGRLFIIEKTGQVRILKKDGTLADRPFVAMPERVSNGTEQGLLGIAFHPKFRENGRFFLDFTDTTGDTHVVERHVSSSDPDLASPDEKELLFIKQPFANHNGGDLVFGPDGKLYVGTGDGGAAYDPFGNGQNPKVLLGKMLRIDVDAPAPKAEVAAIGLRNPWRYTFDRKTGDLYIADVGQDKFEEIDVVPGGKIDGLNFGWSIMEGLHCLKGDTCDRTGLTMPVVEYPHPTGCSVTGGYVYRGKAIPAIDGLYFYSDFCTSFLKSFRWDGAHAADPRDWKQAADPTGQLNTPTTFGEDEDGELYVASLSGVVYKLTP